MLISSEAVDALTASGTAALTAADLLAWCQRLCLDSDLSRAEPRTLRYRLLRTAGCLVHRSRQVLLSLPEHWPWANELAHAYQRLGVLTN